MNQPEQFQIVSQIVETALDFVPSNWRELMINYHIEGSRSTMVNTVMIETDGGLGEEALSDIDELDDLLIELQQHLAQAGRPEFTQCKIHVKADGHYEATYGYDKVDWNALLLPDWNFFPKKTTKN